MCRFIESIRVLNGEVKNLSFHQDRFNRTRSEVLGLTSHPDLAAEILIPSEAKQGLFKCRVLYGKNISEVELLPYRRPKIHSLKLVESHGINYAYKSVDRSELTALYSQRDLCDDILIVKNGLITDSYFANVVLCDGSSWVTPDEPLLAGTMRALLLENGTIQKRSIGVDDLSHYKTLRLVNALNGWDKRLEISIDALNW